MAFAEVPATPDGGPHMPDPMIQTSLVRAIKTLLGAWAFAAVLGTAHHVIHFRSDLGATLSSSVFLPVLGALLGPFVGLLSGAPYFTWQFKVCLASALSVSVGLFLVGVQGQASWWRWLVGGAGALLWMVAGLIGFGPQ